MHRELLIPVLLLGLSGVAHGGAPERPPRVTRDVFRDGSGRQGPELVIVGATAFTMGSRPGEPGATPEERPHRVELSPYAIGRYEVTFAEFAEFLSDCGNREDGGRPWLELEVPGPARLRQEGRRFPPEPGMARRPVVGVSWRGARAYTRWLSQRTGQRYRLPTEAEWEAAARAGADTAWPWGDTLDEARFQGQRTSGGKGTRDVGAQAPNAWGVHDALGNVWEWTGDCFDPGAYATLPSKDPAVPREPCSAPVIRGGSFRDPPYLTRPGMRTSTWWWGAYDGVGFRVAREESPAPSPASPARSQDACGSPASLGTATGG